MRRAVFGWCLIGSVDIGAFRLRFISTISFALVRVFIPPLLGVISCFPTRHFHLWMHCVSCARNVECSAMYFIPFVWKRRWVGRSTSKRRPGSFIATCIRIAFLVEHYTLIANYHCQFWGQSCDQNAHNGLHRIQYLPRYRPIYFHPVAFPSITPIF